MANYKFPLGRLNVGGVATEVNYYIADTDAGKPVTGLNVGDPCYCVDTGAKYTANSSTTWREDSKALFSQTADVGHISGEGEASLVGAGSGSKTIPAGFFTGGRILRVTAGGRILITQPGTMTLRVRMKKGSTVIADTGAVIFPTSSAEHFWKIEAVIMSTSTTAVYTHALMSWVDPPTGIATPKAIVMSLASGGAGTTISSAAEDFGLTAHFQVDVLSSYIYCRQLTLESFGAI